MKFKMSKFAFYSIFFYSATKVLSPSWWLLSMIHDGVMVPCLEKSTHISNLRVLIDGWLVGWMFLERYCCWTNWQYDAHIRATSYICKNVLNPYDTNKFQGKNGNCRTKSHPLVVFTGIQFKSQKLQFQFMISQT
jgi:hypothetical protein